MESVDKKETLCYIALMDSALNTATKEDAAMVTYSITKLYPSGLWEISTLLHGQLIRYRYNGSRREAVRKFLAMIGI